METGLCLSQGRGVVGTGGSAQEEISPMPPLLQPGRASSRTGQPAPSRQHRIGCSGVSGDGWRACPKPCTRGPRRRPRPAPSAGTSLACEALWKGTGFTRFLPCKPPCPAVVWTLEGPGPAPCGPGTCGSTSLMGFVPPGPPWSRKATSLEDTSMNSSLPFIPRATAQRQMGGPQTILEQVGKSPCSWSQKLVSTSHAGGQRLECPAWWEGAQWGDWSLGKASVCASA